MHVGLVSGEVFSPLVNIGSWGVTGAAALFPDWMPPMERVRRCMAWAVGTRGGGVA